MEDDGNEGKEIAMEVKILSYVGWPIVCRRIHSLPIYSDRCGDLAGGDSRLPNLLLLLGWAQEGGTGWRKSTGVGSNHDQVACPGAEALRGLGLQPRQRQR